ncbi:eukaryotic translation initiation factor 3 subunit A [Colletotrichum sp. SAR 10_86]|nr:eukaryotic translation initiation factor 3 subunit A [Colletotrichum sp. SAR 10_86]
MDSHAKTISGISRPGDYGASTLEGGKTDQHRPNPPSPPHYNDKARDIHEAFSKTKAEILRDRRSWHYLDAGLRGQFIMTPFFQPLEDNLLRSVHKTFQHASERSRPLTGEELEIRVLEALVAAMNVNRNLMVIGGTSLVKTIDAVSHQDASEFSNKMSEIESLQRKIALLETNLALVQRENMELKVLNRVQGTSSAAAGIADVFGSR